MTLDEWLGSRLPADGFGVSRSLHSVTGETSGAWFESDDDLGAWYVYVLADGTAVTFWWEP